MEGIFERAQQALKAKSNRQMGVVFIDDIVDFVQTLRENEFDSHIVIQGQNGTGKSYFMLALLKKLTQYNKNKDFLSVIKDNIFYSFNEVYEIIERLVEAEDQVFGIDEAKKFLHYKQSMTREQIVLINTFEYIRSKRNCLVSCANDVRRLNNNYRNSKAQVLIWFLDRFPNNEKRKIVSYGLVFIGLPSVEEVDKFMIDDIENVYNSEGIRVLAENKPTMVGYVLFEDIHKYLTEEEIKLYKELKNKGIQESHQKELNKFISSEAYVNYFYNKNVLGKNYKKYNKDEQDEEN